MKLTNLNYAIGIGVALFLGAFAVLVLTAHQLPAMASPFGTPLGFTATTSTAINVSTASVRVLATSTNPTDTVNSHPRVYASICNPSATVVYLLMNQDKPATASTSVAVIAASTGYPICYEITDRNIYNGSITGITTAGNAWVNVNDYVQ